MKTLALAVVLVASSASAQSFAPGAAMYPSPTPGRHFLDQPVATCVIAVPVNQNAVMLTPCPTGPVGPVGPVGPTPPPAPVAEPKAAEPREPVVIRIEVVPVPPSSPAKPAPVAPKAAPKKVCPCP